MFTPPENSKIEVRLNGHIESIANQLFGDPISKCGAELHYKDNGSISVNTEKQIYCDHTSGKGGHPFGLILLAHDEKQGEAIKWAKNYLEGNPSPPPPNKPSKNQTNEGLIFYALSMIEQSQSSKDTTVQKYLKNRGITDPALIDTLRFIPDWCYGGDAMIAISTDEGDSPVAVQVTFLTKKGEKIEDAPSRKTYKIKSDWTKKGAVRFPGTGTLIVCEGVENAMSCAQVTGQPALAVLGVSNFGKYVPPNTNSLIVCPDGDIPDSKAKNAVKKATDQYMLSGVHNLRIAAIEYDAENKRKIDANDILREQGADALKEILDAAEPAGLSYKGEIQRLAAMDPDDCAPLVKSTHADMSKRGIEVSLQEFRDAIKRARPDAQVNNAKQKMLTSAAQPSDELRPGDELFTDVVDVIRRLVILEEHQAQLVAAYVMYTHVFDSFDICPRLFINAPARAAGKTLLSSILSILVERPLSATNVSVAAMFRLIELESPTLVIGEVDSFMGQSESHRNLVNSGHFRDEAYVLRTFGDQHQPKRFSTFAPMILSGIGDLHHTVMSRSIVVTMKRKTRDESIDRFNRKARYDLKELQSEISRWAMEVNPALEDYEPVEPISALDDRTNDNAEPLLVIARLCGPDWEEKVTKAFLAISLSHEELAEKDLKILALSDLRDCFVHHKQNVPKGCVFTQQVIKYFCACTDRPWAESGKSGNNFSEHKLGHLLNGLVPKSTKVSQGKTRLRGFKWSSCQDAFIRYLSSSQGKSPELDEADSINESDVSHFFASKGDVSTEVGGTNAAETLECGHLSTSTPPKPDILKKQSKIKIIKKGGEVIEFN